MNVSASSWLIILLAILVANLPFLNERCFACVPLRRFPFKPFWWRLVELIIFYFALGAFAFSLESLAGNRFMQTWEFYAITACLFIVLAFPGFVFRYLKK
ncbi:MAG: DUF2818 family protein [Undibacterium sp.]|nr:DUF2818 family protein [Undibacterium sp.]MDO8702032.1 DUF2818 family protein [Undibacterium sp.]MDO9193818.1 DUF2818 family protein [Undibacterium sp.]